MKRVLAFVVVLSSIPIGACVASRPEPMGHHGSHCHAIDRAAYEIRANDRTALLCGLAVDPTLSAHEAQHLIDITVEADGLSSDKADVFVLLASNPCLAPAERSYMLARMEGAGLFDSDRNRVFVALGN